ncbi:MAG TPA: hypothetical protein VMX77_00050 [Candidatus Bathyarchaeia archaeon]|nr:hypothetical protein [Candidatus Bathyarchaeia archaeon]
MPEERTPTPETPPIIKTPEETPTPPSSPEESPYPIPKPPSKPNFLERFWYLFVILAVLCLFVLGVLLFTMRGSTKPTPVAPTPTPTEEVDQSTQELESQSGSDEIDDIEADLGSTDLTNLDQELTRIEDELVTE